MVAVVDQKLDNRLLNTGSTLENSMDMQERMACLNTSCCKHPAGFDLSQGAMATII